MFAFVPWKIVDDQVASFPFGKIQGASILRDWCTWDDHYNRGFVIFPGKVTGIESFRTGTIGHVFPEDIDRLIATIGDRVGW